MSMQKGNLSIHSENIFPIIKKWLYSDHDIFIRELVSNACDAITKVKALSGIGEAELGDDTDFNVQVILNKTAKTLKFIDNGIGMTEDEVNKYINQIAFSGAEDFLNTYKEKGDMDQIIGHFGLGFYSAFMVADTVEINTLSYTKGATSVKWRCNGGTEFEMEEGSKKSRGTEITLYIGQDGETFLDEYTVKSTIEKYCSFMPYPIYFEQEDKEVEKDEDGNIVIPEKKPINTITPLYLKMPNSCTDDEYKEFYQKTFRDFKEPLFWIHLNMDYPFNLKGILYFPKLNTQFDTIEGQIKLYNNQVFVADNIKEVIPEFLLLLKGVIDCPDLPLNVSRSSLQNDGFAKKISDYITKKVADKLNNLFNADRQNFEKFWDDINPFIKFGILKDDKFHEKVEEIVLYKTTSDKYMKLSEYMEAYSDKLDKMVYYVTDKILQAQYIKLIKEHDVDALILDHPIDSPFISHIEMKKSEIKFKRVDSDISELLIDKEDKKDEEADKNELSLLENAFKKSLGNDALKLKVETLKSAEVAGMIILAEESRRMQDMMKRYSFGGFDNNMLKSDEMLVLNKKHELVKYLIEHGSEENELNNIIIKQIYDLAMLAHKPLEPAAMTEFILRSNEIMKKMIG